MNYTYYIFDLYGTLVDIHTDEESDSLWETMAQFFHRHCASYSPSELRTAYETGSERELELADEFQVESVFRQMFLNKKVIPSDYLIEKTCRLFRTTSTEYIRLYPGTLELLESLRQRRKNVYLLSNAQRSFTAPEIQMLGLEPYFDKIFISSDYRVKKPNPDFFHVLPVCCTQHPEKCLMIGNDEICDIQGAQNVGMDTFYIHSNLSPEYTGKVKATYMQMEPVESLMDLQIP